MVGYYPENLETHWHQACVYGNATHLRPTYPSRQVVVIPEVVGRVRATNRGTRRVKTLHTLAQQLTNGRQPAMGHLE